MKKTMRKMFLLAVLTMLLGVFALTDLGTTPSGAAPCCSACEDLEYYCEELPPGTQRNACYRSVANCYRWCTFSC